MKYPGVPPSEPLLHSFECFRVSFCCRLGVLRAVLEFGLSFGFGNLRARSQGGLSHLQRETRAKTRTSTGSFSDSISDAALGDFASCREGEVEIDLERSGVGLILMTAFRILSMRARATSVGGCLTREIRGRANVVVLSSVPLAAVANVRLSSSLSLCTDLSAFSSPSEHLVSRCHTCSDAYHANPLIDPGLRSSFN